MGQILNSREVFVWCFIMLAVFRGSNYAKKKNQEAMHYDLDLLTKKSIGHILHSGSFYIKFHDDKCEGKADHWPFDLNINTRVTSSTHGESLCMKVHVDRCTVKGKQLCDITHFRLSMYCDLPKINRADLRLLGSLCMKFHDDRCKGKTITWHKPFSVINALWPWLLAFWPRNQ